MDDAVWEIESLEPGDFDYNFNEGRVVLNDRFRITFKEQGESAFVIADKGQLNQETGEVDPELKPFDNFILAGCMTALKYLIMIGLYVGVVCIIYGAYTFKPPAGTWPGETIPPPAPAVACTFIMSGAFFIIYALVQFSRTWSEFTEQKFSTFEKAMLDSTKAMNFGPMLCVLCCVRATPRSRWWTRTPPCATM